MVDRQRSTAHVIELQILLSLVTGVKAANNSGILIHYSQLLHQIFKNSIQSTQALFTSFKNSWTDGLKAETPLVS